MFENEDQEQQPCVMCHQPNQQMLMLSCVHDPCVNCAASHYVQNQPHNSPIYTCAKCGQETDLDQSSVAELQRVYASLKNKRKVKNTTSATSNKERIDYRERDNYESREAKPASRTRGEPLEKSRGIEEQHGSKYYPSVPVSQPSYSTGNKKTGYQPIYPCNDHQDQELTYFCFSCNRPICPECAIHGLHKDHEVQTTRKAIKQIKQLLAEDRQKLDAEMNQLATNRERAKKLSKEWVDENKRDQQYIKKKIAQIRGILNEKQKELIRSSEVNLERNCQVLRNQAIASDRALEQISGVKRNIDMTLKKEDLVVLQEFNKRDDETVDAVQIADREREKMREQQIKNPLKALDMGLYEDDIDRIIGQIQSLKLAAVTPKS